MNAPAFAPRPRAVTMWDFSWIERRWPGAGYESWDLALDQLVERGYDAVRIDAFPHLIAAGASQEWTLVPVWDQQDWGSPSEVRVRLQPELNQFIAKCRDRGIMVGLSSWYREDTTNARMKITSAAAMAEQWLATLASIARDGLLHSILWVDLCNEWPGDIWAPYFRNDPPELTWGGWHTETSLCWMNEALAIVRREHPSLPLCFSFDGMDDTMYVKRNLSAFDLVEHHTWMAKENDGEFPKTAGYNYERFSPQGFRNLAKNALKLYRDRPEHWRGLLTRRIASLSAACAQAGQPLVTTECWAIVDYKDWPLLEWDWVKELCEVGVTAAAATGQWAAIATSNFCGPQFVGMWRDVAWHRRMTDVIKSAAIAPALHDKKLVRRLASVRAKAPRA